MTTVRVLGYAVRGYDSVLDVSYVTGLESTERKARKTLEHMLTHDATLSDKERGKLRVVRVTEVIEEI
jgi:hypothetical protein